MSTVIGRVIGRPINGLSITGQATETRQGREVLHMGHFYSSVLHRWDDGRWLASYYDRERGEADWRELTDAEAADWERSWTSTKHMKSREVRDNWKDVREFVRNGGEIVVEHYNRPDLRITRYEENAMIATVSREAIVAWLGDRHGLNDEGISALLDQAAEIGRRFPGADDKQWRLDRLWWAYQGLVTAAAPTGEEALDTIHGKGRTGVDPWETA